VSSKNVYALAKISEILRKADAVLGVTMISGEGCHSSFNSKRGRPGVLGLSRGSSASRVPKNGA